MFWLSILANSVWDRLTALGSGLATIAVLALAAWLWVRIRNALRLRRVSGELIAAANRAVHGPLNAVPPMQEAVLQREYELWEHEQSAKLRGLRVEGVCSDLQFDHFETLISCPAVDGSSAKGRIAEKAKRLKEIAQQLEEKADRLWPF